MALPACQSLKEWKVTNIVTHPKRYVKVQQDLPAQQYLKTGRYQKAIDAYKAAHTENPSDQALLNNYIKTIEEINNIANKSFRVKNYDQAGKIYSLLLKNYSGFKRYKKRLSFDSDFLNTRITDFSNRKIKSTYLSNN